MRLVSAVSVAALLALAAVLALAGPLYGQSRGALPPADDMEAAKAHFAAGSAYYDQANYADAVKEFNEAFRLSKRTDLLYNIAVCYERLNDLDHALTALKRYLADRPDAPDKVTVQSRITNLEKRRALAAATPTATPTPPPTAVVAPPVIVSSSAAPPSLRRGGRLWWVPGTALLGGGLVLGVVSLGTGVAAHTIYNDLKSACPNEVCPESERARRDEGQTLSLVSTIFTGVALAAGVTGAILLIVQSRPVSARQACIRPTADGAVFTF